MADIQAHMPLTIHRVLQMRAKAAMWQATPSRQRLCRLWHTLTGEANFKVEKCFTWIVVLSTLQALATSSARDQIAASRTGG
jgi:hypothetical protein